MNREHSAWANVGQCQFCQEMKLMERVWFNEDEQGRDELEYHCNGCGCGWTEVE